MELLSETTMVLMLTSYIAGLITAMVLITPRSRMG
jgi:hypothetical protein